ncbi:uncharacterized protein LY79DRAFT_410226 [Colletotrichum navitas]|uniref:Transmembrane protein n=1 Tax=Colletotrichum navitas TaxID=681940 RepID=A0AAD8PNU9_9PEZI|nr:uncharacterized protein LY79DRAFT_410226 [Colletotrichum navitas]KAK1573541.1 hypothetical protein LY79DRAFT_410226 [Colletotrichum navitas]
MRLRRKVFGAVSRLQTTNPPGGCLSILSLLFCVPKFFACWEIFVFLFPFSTHSSSCLRPNTPPSYPRFFSLETNSFFSTGVGTKRTGERTGGRTRGSGTLGMGGERTITSFFLVDILKSLGLYQKTRFAAQLKRKNNHKNPINTVTKKKKVLYLP